jgi:hypothetical protein
MLNNAARLILSRKIHREPIITKIGSKVRIAVELATVVHRIDSIQNKKCKPNAMPESNSLSHNNGLIRIISCLWETKKGSKQTFIISNRYMAVMAIGDVDHLIKIDEKEIAIIPSNNINDNGMAGLLVWINAILLIPMPYYCKFSGLRHSN